MRNFRVLQRCLWRSKSSGIWCLYTRRNTTRYLQLHV